VFANVVGEFGSEKEVLSSERRSWSLEGLLRRRRMVNVAVSAAVSLPATLEMKCVSRNQEE
jgi:hypothetical protein